MSTSVQPVVLCGGSGTRLWPLSCAEFPKPFLTLTGNASLFQHTLRRAVKIGSAAPMVVGNEAHRQLMETQARAAGIDFSMLLLEPVGRNTAPALTLAALAACADGDDPVLVVMPADHHVEDTADFLKTVQQAVTLAKNGAIVMLGITPNQPETAYGYIRAAGQRVEGFTEKPDHATAARYVLEGGYYWNSGMFILKASVWLVALQQFRPEMAMTSQHAWKTGEKDGHTMRPNKALFTAVPSESIDYAVMESCPGVFPMAMLPLASGWSDLGTWPALWQHMRAKEATIKGRRGHTLTYLQLMPGDSIVLPRVPMHWVILSGSADVLHQDKVRQRYENHGMPIDMEGSRGVTNPGPGVLEIIEVRSDEFSAEGDSPSLNDPHRRVAQR